MAGFRQHVTFSSLLGIGYGAAATFLLEFSPVEGALAGCLAGVGGMLPDLDAPNGKPGQEIFALTGAVAPLLLIGRVLDWTGLPHDAETVMLLLVGLYITIRYGLAALLHRVSVHRGMFHSLPAMVIAGELVYLSYPGDTSQVHLLMAGAVTLGFFSHLLLDEIWSVEWKGALPSLKKSAGTAIKMFGPTLGANVISYALLGSLTYAVLLETGIVQHAGPPLQLTSPDPAIQLPDVDMNTAPAAPPSEWDRRLRASQAQPARGGDAPIYRGAMNPEISPESRLIR